MKRSYVAAAIAILACLLLTVGLVMFFAPAPNQLTPTQQVVSLADNASAQVNVLIDNVYANQTALDTIEQFGLLGQLEGNVSIYRLGASNLTKAHEQLNAANYGEASPYSLQAMSNFRAA